MPHYATIILTLVALASLPVSSAAQESDVPIPAAKPATATVYWAQEVDAIRNYQASAPAARRMVDALVRAVTGQKTTTAAWRSLVSPTDTVGIKVTTDGGSKFSTSFAVVASIIEGLKSADLPAENIVVWGRSSEAMRVAGLTPTALGCRVAAVDNNYLEQPVYFSPRLGKLIWGDREFRPDVGLVDSESSGSNKNLSNKSHFAALLGTLDKIINVPVLSDSAFTGLNGSIASLAVDSIDNWRRFGLPLAHGAEDLPQIWANEVIGPKVVINFFDALTIQYAGGPWFEPNYAVEHARIYASRDPVALDQVALTTIEALREQAKLPPAEKKAAHIKLAGQLGLGVADPDKIKRQQVTP